MVNILIFLALIALPLAGYHAIIGGLLGLLQALSVLIPLTKAPLLIKEIVSNNPMISDVVLSGLAAWATHTFFGGGLMLGVATAVTAVILSISLPRLTAPIPNPV
jgi:hypothetical protein